jgi:transcription-repair coupling factor (superfamily II helicase)
MSIELLIQLLGESTQSREILRLLDEGERCIQVEGLAVAAKSAMLTSLRGSSLRPILVITYSFEQAERLYDDIVAILPGTDDVFLVPPAARMIYQEADSDSEIIGRRLAALTSLVDGGVGIVIAPISSVLQRTLPPQALASHRLRIEKSQEIDIQDCAKSLVSMGYKRVDLVEHPGEFSRRGGILDVFASSDEYPVRIDLFGDEVDSICKFDVESQRSAGERKSITISPAREILLEDEIANRTADELAQLLKTEVDRLESDGRGDVASKLSRRIEEDITRIRNQAYFPGVEFYFPVAYKQKFSLLDYLPADSVVVMDEPHQIKAHWEQLHEELLQSLAARIEKGDVLPLPEDHVISFDEAADRLKVRGQSLLFSLLPRPLSWLEVGTRVEIQSTPMDSFSAQMGLLVEQVKTWVGNGCRVVVVSAQPTRLVELLTERQLSVSPISEIRKAGIFVISGRLRSGFKLPESKLMVLTDGELFGFSKAHRPRKTFKQGMSITSLLEIAEGDYVVHVNHGIGRYRGITKLAGGGGGDRDYLLVEYAGSDRIYVPVDQIDRIQKYIGSDGVVPTLNKLGSADWAKTTKKVKQSVREMAKDLVALYAARQASEGYMFGPDTPWQEEMESAFEYEETPDQLDAIQDIKHDLESPKPMDRLICGDVGYGKTEVAMRAVFKVVNEGKQAVILCPTTVLAQQHFNTFSERLAPYPVKIDMLSRFKTKQEAKKVVEGLRTGEIDICIGTHRLLSKDIEFKDLGLLVIDEEHRFGVAHKERLKQLRKTVDVLTLSATPIPRTLHMSLSGIRDMSLINDPPEGRIAVKTYCQEFEDEMVRDAILAELDRDGQIYFVHNRVENIEHIAEHLRTLVPYARIEVAHGQMDEDELERAMVDFYERRFDILVCTTIIESGLDIPNANTIIVNNADKMGLAQLYQLRGRVGRSNRQAYAYLFYEPHRIMTEIAEKRLGAIKEFSDLGSGFKVALRDLEIRGAGNLLGAEQHGQMASVGFDMYCQLLSEAIGELKGEEPEQFELPTVELPMDAFIPTNYIPTESLRLSFYKRMTAVRDTSDVENLQEEIRDRFGKLPAPVKTSLDILHLRLKIANTGIDCISSDRRQVTIKFSTGVKLAGDILPGLRRKFPMHIFNPDKVIVSARNVNLIGTLSKLLDVLPKALEDSKAAFFAKLF